MRTGMLPHHIIQSCAERSILMTISCHLRILLARVNVELARQGKPALSLRRLAQECGVSLSVLAALHTGRSQRVDYATIDRLLNYFSRYFNVNINDLLGWEKTLQPEPYGESVHA
jgi:DNA-binding Xre family transcriptional regulator